VRHLFRAVLIAATIQVPFLILMNVAGIHSALGGAWFLFYIPAVLVLALFGLPTPKSAPSSTITEVALIQEIILVGFILTFMALYRHFRLPRKNSSEARSIGESKSRIGR
jgi:hypothetical protein